jgi:hypothetical protein
MHMTPQYGFDDEVSIFRCLSAQHLIQLLRELHPNQPKAQSTCKNGTETRPQLLLLLMVM